MLVAVPVSSRNTSRRGSSHGWRFFHTSRAVGALRLGGVHGFFKADAVPLEEPPDRAHANPHAALAQQPAGLFRGEIGPPRISANSHSVCGGERLRPFCDLATAIPVHRQRPIQAVAVDSPMPNRRPAPRAEKPPSTAPMTRMRRSLEYALTMPSPNSIYGPILTQTTIFGNPSTRKFRIYPTGNR
jgi:hypothetical protein